MNLPPGLISSRGRAWLSNRAFALPTCFNVTFVHIVTYGRFLAQDAGGEYRAFARRPI
jgi:hypothetical protein